MANEREDFAIAWDTMGEIICDTYFPKTLQDSGRLGFDKRARMDFAHDATKNQCTRYMQMWGGIGAKLLGGS